MSEEQDEPVLRDLFQRLRREETRQAPPFPLLWETARAGRGMAPGVSRQGLVWASACAMLFLGLGIWFGRLGALRPASRAVPMTISQWRSPTDFLLKVSGDRVLTVNGTTGQLNGWLP